MCKTLQGSERLESICLRTSCPSHTNFAKRAGASARRPQNLLHFLVKTPTTWTTRAPKPGQGEGERLELIKVVLYRCVHRLFHNTGTGMRTARGCYTAAVRAGVVDRTHFSQPCASPHWGGEGISASKGRVPSIVLVMQVPEWVVASYRRAAARDVMCGGNYILLLMICTRHEVGSSLPLSVYPFFSLLLSRSRTCCPGSVFARRATTMPAIRPPTCHFRAAWFLASFAFSFAVLFLAGTFLVDAAFAMALESRRKHATETSQVCSCSFLSKTIETCKRPAGPPGSISMGMRGSSVTD